jgi:predicted small lipoprotein YifL
MRPRRSSRHFLAALPLLLCLLAAACGQKGDLYLPGKSGSQTLASGAR